MGIRTREQNGRNERKNADNVIFEGQKVPIM
jgi:hypothetical protein